MKQDAHLDTLLIKSFCKKLDAELETVYMNHHIFTNTRVAEGMVFDLTNVAFGLLGLLGILFMFVYQFSYLLLICSISLMVTAIVYEAAKKFSIKFF